MVGKRKWSGMKWNELNEMEWREKENRQLNSGTNGVNL